MKKVMKTFIFGSKGFMRILLLCMIACFSLTQARADYYYKVKLADKDGNVHQINEKEWSDWIFVSKGSGLAKALNKLIGGKFTEQVKDTDGKLKFKYKDGNNNEVEVSLSEAELNGLKTNNEGKYLYPVDGNYVLNPVTKDVYRLGRTIKDESGIDISLEYTIDGNIVDGKEMAKEENFYEKYTHTYKIVGLAIGRGTNDGAILQFSDWDAFSRMKKDLKELDLAAWNKEKVNGSYYMSNMSNLETLILPDHNFAIGDEYMFAGANKLQEIQYGRYDADYKTLTITDDCNVTCIGKGAFKHGYKIPQATIQTMINKAAAYAKANPNANKDGFKYNKIGDEAFYQCYQITELEIPDGIAEIGSDAFSMTEAECSFNKLTFAGSNIKIGDKAFQGCEMLKDIVLGNNVKITNLGEAVFADSRCISNESVASILNNYAANSAETENITGRGYVKYIPAYLFFGVQGKGDHNNCQLNFDKLNIPDAFGAIGEGAFGHTEADIQQFKEIIVNAAVAPVCGKPEGVYRGKDIDDDVFSNVGANHVTITFNGAAAGYSTDGSTGYMTYRNEPEFMRLLTKTLDENSTDYTVVPQRHADVRLYRTFKEGWNTLVLPFGARVIGDWRVDAAEIFQKALNVANDNDNVSNPNDTPGFMIAAYRGLAKNEAQPDNSTFYFLQYANYKEDPLDECEPLLIKMRQEDINKANGVYTFKDVELNYDGDNNKTYTADEVIARMGKKENGNYFDGNYNHDANDKFGKCTYNDFYFTGTLYKQTGIATEGSAFIAPGDYIIQNNTFVKCLSGKKYGLKGFRGYFKQKPLGRTSPAKGIGICLVDRNGVVSSIHQVDGVSLTPASVAPAAVYNLSGQQVGNSLSTLAKGVYIVNGKKFVKK